MSSDIILDVRKLEKNYNTATHEGKETIYSVLKGISFQVHKGEFIMYHGKFRMWKTTLLKLLECLASQVKELYYIREGHTESMEKILPGYEERRFVRISGLLFDESVSL